jgi:hypothetical protein
MATPTPSSSGYKSPLTKIREEKPGDGRKEILEVTASKSVFTLLCDLRIGGVNVVLNYMQVDLIIHMLNLSVVGLSLQLL